MIKPVIVAAKRTPIGSFMGNLSTVPAASLGSATIRKIIDELSLEPELVDEVILGNVLSASMGQAPARQTALLAGLPFSTECLTINKVCGSGLKAIMLAANEIALGNSEIIIAGGIESMSNAPYYITEGRRGNRLGNINMLDSILTDGLTDVYSKMHMGAIAELTASDYGISRMEVDEIAIASYTRAIEAQKRAAFQSEIVPVQVLNKSGEIIVSEDEEPSKVNFEKIPLLKPAFEKNGIITAANSSKINDGAATVLIMSELKAKRLGLKPLFEIASQVSYAHQPEKFTTAPVFAIEKLLRKAGLQISDIDLFEINEAFAVVSIIVNRLLGISNEKVNVNGGAIALGHPIGASGTRILTTLIYEMIRRESKYGVAALCIGGGEASTVLLKKYQS